MGLTKIINTKIQICIKSVFVLLILLCVPTISHAQGFSEEGPQVNITPYGNYEQATIKEISSENIFNYGDYHQIVQNVKALITSGNSKGETVDAQFETSYSKSLLPKYKIGDRVVLGQVNTPDGNFYDVVDSDRRINLIWISVFFIALALVIGKLKGATAVVGLATTAGIIIYFFIPHLVKGTNPFILTLITTFILSLTSIYITHGFNKKTTISVLSTLITLFFAVILSFLAVKFTHLNGVGNDTSYLLQLGLLDASSLKGIFLAGIIIGTLGILEDVTITQTASVAEIFFHKPHASFNELFISGMTIGREHIAALINTLLLAYVGTSLPVLVLLSASKEPIWVLLNSEPIAEEIVRTLAGSAALIIAVPISTALAAWMINKKNTKQLSEH